MRVAALMNDLVTVSLPSGGDAQISMLEAEGIKRILGGDGSLTIQINPVLLLLW